jgi:polygalacturonase
MDYFKFILIICISVFLFNSSSCLNIDDFGAKSNDSSYNTSITNGKAFLSAILAANNGPDRTVLIEGGKIYTMLPAGLMVNLTNITIQIDARVNAWSGEETLWPKKSNNDSISLFSMSNTKGLVIKGNGIIDGFGYAWWWAVILTGYDNRPNIFDISYGEGTFIDGITVLNAAQYHFSLSDQLNCTVQNVKIHVDITDDEEFIKWLPTFPLNTDGIDISGKDIYFRNLTIQNFDDAVAVKPTKRYDNTFTNCTENILIEDCVVKYGVGMSIGSVPPNENLKCVRNVTFRNIKFINPLKAIYIKPNPGDSGSGLIANITYENIEIIDALWWAVYVGTQQQQQPHSGGGTGCSFFYPLPGTKCETDPLVTIDTVVLRNVNIYGGLLSPGILICNATNPCTNFLFDNVNVYNRSVFPVQDGFLCDSIQGFARNSNLFPNCLTNITGIELLD